MVWLGVPGSMESRLVPANGFPIEWVRVAGIRGKGLGAWVLAPLRIAGASFRPASAAAREARSVLGAGGYVSGPGGIAAWLLPVPLLIHEQNAVAGMTNRWLARIATPGARGVSRAVSRPRVQARAVGNPVRADIAASSRAGRSASRGRGARARLLVFGGSQGAQRLNALVPQALARLDPEAPAVRHQAGDRGIDAARAAYAESGSRPRCCPSSTTWRRPMPGRTWRSAARAP